MSKTDFTACDALAAAEDDEVARHVEALLEWLQDMNWPVAPRVCERLIPLGNSLAEQVRKVLVGSDPVWKYWVITELVANAEPSLAIALQAELRFLASSVNEVELNEEVPLASAKVLAKCVRSA
ncbi:DUF5071 domain-containing protein [Thiosocius teredinicola]|uniref:DUF5071 domain-containing protein n=1 Tax=Thiosocius teredinicola TaxID=1973002 RepID=UPI0013DE412D